MPTRELDFAEIRDERELACFETSMEAFDRLAFARHALDLVGPRRTTVAICEGARGVRVEAGRQWGRPLGERWAVLMVPPRASRRAIAVAVAGLASGPEPYALDILLAPQSSPSSSIVS